MSSNEVSQVAVFGGVERVPLGANTGSQADTETVPLPRPFGFRFARRMPDAVPIPASRWCPVRQITVTTDGTDSPWYRVVSGGVDEYVDDRGEHRRAGQHRR